MKTKILSLIALAFLQSEALEIKNKLSGSAASSSKIGLNINQSPTKVNPAEGILPTESFSVIRANVDYIFSLTHEGHYFDILLGGSFGGVVYDSTKNLVGGSQIYKYIGYWAGVANTKGPGNKDTRNYILYNANVFYRYDRYFSIRIGRFGLDIGDWQRGFREGVDIRSQAIPNTTLWFFATNKGAAVAKGGPWLRDFRYINVNDTKGDWDYGRGFWLFGTGAQVIYKNFTIHPMFYAQDSRFVSPTLDIIYNFRPDFDGKGFNFKTQVVGMYAYYLRGAWHLDASLDNFQPETKIKGGGGSLFIKQTFFYDNYEFGAALYTTFSDPHQFFGGANPTGFDSFTGTIYQFTTWNNVFRKDAHTGWAFVGGSHKDLTWRVVGRYTNATRAQEQSVLCSFTYKFTKNFEGNFTIQYYGLTTKAGHLLGTKRLLQDTYSDRSSIRTSLVYFF
ncbi:outer membrane protein [Helicobacter mustelae]|uniref:outer membrane family protein n=1 Tax=Helicobacter mustelae TaxID=217 RepID=UPI000E028764|nr:outer membrane family protein [Helicobacter mustelae]STP14172.1 outer membrane protein [Helicobacter mustelae]